jgi:predicted  nucleic acid-binding Zn-ribbon protein
VKTFWVAEFASWSEKYATEAIAPVQNKVGQFLSSSVIRNIVAQVKSTVNLRRIMDDEKILIVNLSKGRIGEDNMRLLGGMIVTKIQLAAQERQNIPEKDRRDFYLFVDEFQNFANESFASILSEARKFRLNLIVAHQYIEQLEEEVAAAIFGNVGTIIVMRVGGADATAMETEFMPTFTPEDLVNLAKYQVYLKLMVDGVSTAPFSAGTLGPVKANFGSAQRVIEQSRERYAEPRPIIEEKVLKWAGMETTTELPGTVSTLQDIVPTTVETSPTIKLPTAVTEALAPTVPAHIHYPEIKTEDELNAPPDNSEFLKIKPERLAAIQSFVASSQAAQKQSKRPAFKHTCSRCGKTFELAIQLDPTRPMYCAECRPIVAEERKSRQKDHRQVRRDTVTPAAAPTTPNRPRIVRDPASPSFTPPQIQALPKDEDEDEDLLTAIMKTKDRPVELRKQVLEQQAGTIEPPKKKRKRGGRGRNKDAGAHSVGATHASPRQTPKPVSPGQKISF